MMRIKLFVGSRSVAAVTIDRNGVACYILGLSFGVSVQRIREVK